jgi:hypothetical protein
MVSDHEMRMEALRLFEENEKLATALKNLLDCGNAIIAASPEDPKAEEAFDMYGKARKAARDVLRTIPPKGPAGDRGQVGWMGGEFDR